jgi:hypothetical protein|tara:strand:- start:426 stop:695 length:270 start_codon:yes stop_codon:yes gene_type:complete
MPELVLDCPMIHEYLWKNVIDPLMRRGLLKPKFIRWNVDPKDKPPVEDDDDISFDSSDAQLKLMARILSDYKKGEDNNPRSWEDVFKYY